MKDDSGSAVQAETRRLAAIMFTDIVGFSRQMGSNEARTLRLLDIHNQIIRHAVAEYHGTVIKTVGDAFLVDFPSVVHAVQCAQAIQTQLHKHNAETDKAEQIHIRIGIHSGDIVQRDGDVFGDGVNIASRLQELAEPDAICFSDVVYRDVARKLDLGAIVSLGRPKLKNIAERFAVYALLAEAPTGLRQTLRVQRLKLSRRLRPAHRAAVVGLLLIATTVVVVRYFPLVSPSSRPPTPNTPALPLPNKPSIVVLPFVNMSNDPEQEYFSDGITEDLTSDLSKIAGLFVIARNSAFTYKGKVAKVQEVSREMGVRYVVEGSVRKANDQVRITAQLIDGTTGGHLWSERYDRPLQDIFRLQDEIVQKIIGGLRVEVREAEQRRVKRLPTQDLNAYDAALRGWEYYHHVAKETNVQARQMFEKAIALDPAYAEGYAGVGWTYWMEWVWQWSQDPQTPGRAYEFAQKAVALDDSLPAAHQLLSQVYALYKGQHEQGIAAGEWAVALDPNNADGYARLALVLVTAAQPEKALETIEKAMRLNPRFPAWYLYWRGLAYSLTGRTEEAITELKKVIAADPNFPGPHIALVSIYTQLEREEEARTEAAEVLRTSPNFSLERYRQGLAAFKNREAVERTLAALRKAGLR
jgi:adenylate cyclase